MACVKPVRAAAQPSLPLRRRKDGIMAAVTGVVHYNLGRHGSSPKPQAHTKEAKNSLEFFLRLIWESPRVRATWGR
jgi:hypothetical protein